MSHLLLIFLLGVNSKSVEVRFCDTPPVIDGYIEDIWHEADSACGFIQRIPQESETATELTIVYLLQDKDNLYVAFKCFSITNKLTVNLGGNEDWIILYVDTFGTGTTAYYFKITTSGIQTDGIILDDGRSKDTSWDGVWYSAVKCFDDRYEVEIKIPFKSIRYKKGLPEWGINFERYISAKQEKDCWTEITEKEGFRVSKFGTLKGINPQSFGYYFETYPEGFVSYNKIDTFPTEIKLKGSLNFKWDLTPQTTLAATIYPDFAQIESDPYTLNFFRYPIRLSEKRPFFVEGSEVFRTNGWEVATPIDIFYSRCIGKSINNHLIPIIGGIKLVGKSPTWNIGVLGALTDSLEFEPKKKFAVLRVNRKISKISDIGMLFNGMMANAEDYNYAIGLDGIHRFGLNRIGLQGAVSNRNRKIGWALSSGGQFTFGTLVAKGSYEAYSDSFDVSDIGYVPWAGKREISIAVGPKFYFKNFVRTFYLAPSVVLTKEPDENQWSKNIILTINPNFRNNWGFSFNTGLGKRYEANLDYIQKELTFLVWGDGFKYATNFGSSYYYSYNWHLNCLAYQAVNWLWFECYPISRFTPILDANIWIEWDTLNAITEITPKVTPRIELQITKDVSCDIFNELVWSISQMEDKNASLISSRIGLLFSYNFRPKSWFYIALNDYRKQIEFNRELELKNQIVVFKVKYLFYF